MPSNYAHYRFGTQILPQLPPELQRTVGRFRQLYDMGLHGPDLLFFNFPANKLGSKFHAQTGKAFFERVCRYVRLRPSEGAMAYLYGVLAHYALDSLSYPFINRMAREGKATKAEIETEFDRFLLETDGKKPPYMQDLSAHMKLTPGECETVAGFYPNVSAGAVRKCVNNMASATRFLVIPQSARRNFLDKAMHTVAPKSAGRLMTVHPNRNCSDLDASLLRLYEMAMDRYPVLLEQIQAHLRRKAPLGTDFSVTFGSE